MSGRLTIRSRLTLLYGTVFLLGGLMLIAIMVFSVRSDILNQPTTEQLHDQASTQAGTPAPPDNAAVAAEERIRRQLRDDDLEQLALNSVGVLGVLVLLSGGAGWWIAGRTLNRLRQVIDAAKRAGENTLHERLDLPGPRDEIKELGDTFDAMLARLDASFEGQRRFVANASHELRTPLAVTRTAVEVTLAKQSASEAQLRAMGEDVRAATLRAESLIDSLLTLARSEQEVRGGELDDLGDLAAEAVDAVRREAARHAVTITADLGSVPVRGDVALLSRAVENLVENAVRHNVRGGSVRVTSGAGGLRVVNDGAVIEPELLGQLFEPFHRGSRTRLGGDGVGLGLSIVRSVARAHGGSVEAEARPEGGLVVTLTLPPVE
ncbi:two-component sensor histidine kinase [Longispora fulva]|uniref:histidine kinase n=1 Tax=Longispora fulva TaxID=619741 RepID=A0A8J7GJW1_9ACTN|nr:HAMP domain-containing sensor histidine kinase [Longispora fulva]MBG6137915.1 signal transduction histidine kinase [Longispora fulva]GIG60168.1 two-component sensor histidine kinase [Longispora fulva]